jgi:hypothetical protein
MKITKIGSTRFYPTQSALDSVIATFGLKHLGLMPIPKLVTAELWAGGLTYTGNEMSIHLFAICQDNSGFYLTEYLVTIALCLKGHHHE